MCFFKTDGYLSLESVIQPWQSMFHKSEIVHLRSQEDKISADLEIFLQGERPGRRGGERRDWSVQWTDHLNPQSNSINKMQRLITGDPWLCLKLVTELPLYFHQQSEKSSVSCQARQYNQLRSVQYRKETGSQIGVSLSLVLVSFLSCTKFL